MTSSARSLKRVDPGTPILIVSDHGFHSWRKAVNLNTWLVQNGYMTLQGQQPAEKKLDDLFGGGEFWENVDWSRTRAYAMGIGQIYFNLRGREAQGIVSPGAEARQLADELAAKLLTMTDPEDGASIIRAVYKRDDIYSGEFLHNASELQVGMHEGYRVSWQTTLGGSPEGIVYAEHEEVERRPRRLRLRDHGRRADHEPARRRAETPSIMDIAPTVLKYFGLPIPGEHRRQGAVLDAGSHGHLPSIAPGGLLRLGSERVHGARRPRTATAADAAKRAEERMRALQREADELLARERTLLVELRKLEVDRQIKVEELAKFEREAAETERKLAATDASGRDAQAERPTSSGRTSRRGSCSSTRWGAAATGGCCSTSTTCARWDAPIARRRR